MMNARRTTSLTALLATVLCGAPAAAIEEVVVIGKDTSVPQRSMPEQIGQAMHDYVRAVNAAHKRRLDAELATLSERRIQVVAAQIPSRG